MTSIGDQSTSCLNFLVQDGVSVANRETTYTRATERYESKDILQVLDNRVSCSEMVINHEVWSNFEWVKDSIEQLGSIAISFAKDGTTWGIREFITM
ncbi:Uncharacterized protein TCM_029692 [Theobroma cacao]|uniref:Uncharacterized protein n=1 Tax=Theobroma cacao TaxID=3641 RepID=A0A061GFQ1_THECC|nr:Uncharacterized protein TCM_029692 [Theobroma cacao]